MKELHIKPAIEGQIIRDPYTLEPLKQDGDKKTDCHFWQRRLADNSVVIVSESKTEKGAK